MKNLLFEIEAAFFTAQKKAFDLDEPVVVTQSTRAEFGHYQCNSALKLAKILGQKPRDVAQKLKHALEQIGYSWIESLEIAGPGFINCTIKTSEFCSRLKAMLACDRLGVDKVAPKRVICEFSSPNIAKAMHVGHLRSTIIGESIARLLEFLGHDVLRLNHVGDWGTQFGMLIAYIHEYHPEILHTKKASVEELMQYYKDSKKKFDESDDFKKRSHEFVVSLQSGQKETLEIWHTICEISRGEFEKIYDLLDVKIQERGESFYNPFLADVVKDCEQKKLVTVSNGAKCMFMPEFIGKDDKPLPFMIQKSDGGFNYASTDLASLRHRIEDEKADWLIYVTDSGQSLHFRMLMEAAKRAGYYDPNKVRIDHVTFGLVLAADGKKFKTRSGETEKLEDLLDEGVQRAKALLKDRIDQDADIQEAAQNLGIGAIKYADLSCNRTKDYTFSYERMLQFVGNTAAFIMYAFVRIQSIKKRVAKPIDFSAEITLEHPTEIALALHLCRFSEALEAAAKELLPNRLSDYLFHLAEAFHAFFRDCRVQGDTFENSRLILCELVSRLVKQGLNLLGLKTLEAM
jgi:arginyl-tRNA synthetase